MRQLEVIDQDCDEEVEEDEVLDDDVEEEVEHDVVATRIFCDDILVNLEPVVECEELKKREEGGEERSEVRRVDVCVQTASDDGEHVHEESDEKNNGSDGTN